MTTISDDLQRIAQQEQELRLSAFDELFAWRLGSELHDLAWERGLAVAIEVRRFDRLLFYTALAGTTPDHADLLRRKSNTVARFYRSSYAIGLSLVAEGLSFTDKYSLPTADYATHGGGFPLILADLGPVGSVAVSGLKQRDDHALAVEGLCMALGHDYATLALD